MNKVFKVIWSKTKNCYVVASELAKSHTKSPKSSIISRTLVAGVLASICTFGAVLPVFADGPDDNYVLGRNNFGVTTIIDDYDTPLGLDDDPTNPTSDDSGVTLGSAFEIGGSGNLAYLYGYNELPGIFGGNTLFDGTGTGNTFIGDVYTQGGYASFVAPNNGNATFNSNFVSGTVRASGALVNAGSGTYTNNYIGGAVNGNGTYMSTYLVNNTNQVRDSLILGVASGGATNNKNSVVSGNKLFANNIALGITAGSPYNQSAILNNGSGLNGNIILAIQDSAASTVDSTVSGTAIESVMIGNANNLATGTNNNSIILGSGDDISNNSTQSIVIGTSLGSHGGSALSSGTGNVTLLNEFDTPAGGVDAVRNNGTRNVAIGSYTNVTYANYGSTRLNGTVANDAVSIGTDVHNTGDNAIAIGTRSKVTSDGAIAIGNNALASAHSVVIGGDTVLDDTGSLGTTPEAVVVIGEGASVDDNGAIAIGSGAFTADEASLAIGSGSGIAAVGNGAMAIKGFAQGQNAVTFGGESYADHAVSIGVFAGAAGEKSTALGFQSSAHGANSVALGSDSVANDDGVISFGHKAGDVGFEGDYVNGATTYSTDYTRRLVNVSAGEDDTDAVNVAQLNAALANVSSSGSTPYVGINSAAGGINEDGSGATGTDAIVIGKGTKGQGEKDIVIGLNSTSDDGSGDIVIGFNSSTLRDSVIASPNTIVIGNNNKNIVGRNAVLLGNGISVTGYNTTDTGIITDAILIGSNVKVVKSKVTGINGSIAGGETHSSIAIGKGAKIYSGIQCGDAIAIGEEATALNAGVAIGSRAFANGNNNSNGVIKTDYSVALGTNSVAMEDGVVSFGHKANEQGFTSAMTRRLINVSNGKSATDGATVTQTIELVAGDNVTIVPDTTATNSIGQKRYKISASSSGGASYTAGSNIEISDTDEISAVANGTITAGSTGLVTGNTVYEALQNINIPEGTVYTAGNHISIGNDHSIAAVIDGTVSSGNTGLVNGGQVYDAIQNIRPNIYIGGNGIVINGDTNTVSVKNVVMYDSDAQDTATLSGTRGTKLTNLKAATLGQTSTDAVIGNQLWTTNKNIEGVQNSVTINTTNISALNTSMTNALESVTSIGTLVDTIDGLKADKSLNNLDAAGRQVIATAAANAVQEYMANNKVIMNRMTSPVVMNNVVPDDWSSIDDELSLKADKDDVYSKSETDTLLDAKADVSVVSDLETNLTGNISALDERVTSAENAIQDTRDALDVKADKEDVYDKEEVDSFLADKADKADLDAKADKVDLEAKAEVDASNIDADKWSEKLGTGEIAEGNTGLVNGGTVFEAMKSVGGNDMIKAGTDAIEIGSDTKYDGMDSVSIAKSDGTGRALRGVLVDPDDDTSAANVGYVNAVAENISTGVNQGFVKLDDKINKTGANAAALANLHPIADDGDTKWNVAAGFGRYHGESAGAVGLFYKPSDRVAMNISSTIGDDVMFGAGVSVAIDKPVSNGLSKVQMAKTINAQAEHIKQQDERIARLEAAMAQMIRNQK